MERTLDYSPLAFDISPTDNTRKRVMVEEDDSDDSSDQMSLDISRKSKFKKLMEMSIPKGQMEKSMPKAQMEKTIDYDPFAFDISTTDDPMIDEQIGKREDVHPIRLERDTNVPKSSDILPSWKDKDDSISSTEKH